MFYAFITWNFRTLKIRKFRFETIHSIFRTILDKYFWQILGKFLLFSLCHCQFGIKFGIGYWLFWTNDSKSLVIGPLLKSTPENTKKMIIPLIKNDKTVPNNLIRKLKIQKTLVIHVSSDILLTKLACFCPWIFRHFRIKFFFV